MCEITGRFAAKRKSAAIPPSKQTMEWPRRGVSDVKNLHKDRSVGQLGGRGEDGIAAVGEIRQHKGVNAGVDVIEADDVGDDDVE